MAAWLPATIVFSLAAGAGAQPEDTIFDEANVPDYVLPDPLLLQDGTKVGDAETWQTKRRGEVLRLFEEHVHGRGRYRKGLGVQLHARSGILGRRALVLLHSAGKTVENDSRQNQKRDPRGYF